MGDKMIVNGNYGHAAELYKTNIEASDAAEALSRIFGQSKKAAEAQKAAADSVSLSAEAVEAMNKENPVLEEVKEVALEKYFHFGSQYLKPGANQEDTVSALDEVSRYFQAYNDRTVDDIFQHIADANQPSSGDFIEMASKYGSVNILADG
jgi:hypothetical protein